MGAITGTVVASTSFPGRFKVVLVTAAIASASDTITLTEANAKVVSFGGVIGAVITGGADAAFCILQVSVSGLVITVVSLGADGLAATDFTGTTVSISLLGVTSGVS